MNKVVKKLYIAFIIAVLSTLLFTQFPRVHSLELTVPDKALAFIEDVMQIDVSKYNLTLVAYFTETRDDLGGLTEENLRYILESSQSKLRVLFTFIDKTLTWCKLNVLEGSPLYAQPQPNNIIDNAESLLQRHQTYEGGSDLEEMIHVLDNVDATKNTTKTSGDIIFDVSTNVESTYLHWRYSSNDIVFPIGINIGYRDGSFYSFRDDRHIYKVGSTTINISKEEAINIALKYLEDFSWTANNGNDTVIEVTDFTIVDEPRKAGLSTKSREPLTLYPYWSIQLYLDKFYPGRISFISVGLWADSGEVFYCQELGSGGMLLTEAPNNDQSLTLEPTMSSPIQQVDTSLSSLNVTTITVVAATIIGIALATVLIKKKHK